jgi:hypothetical protein
MGIESDSFEKRLSRSGRAEYTVALLSIGKSDKLLCSIRQDIDLLFTYLVLKSLLRS